MSYRQFNMRSVLVCAATALLGMGTTLSVAAKTSTDKLDIGIVSVNHNSPSDLTMGNVVLADCTRRKWNCELFDGKGDMVASNNAGVNFVNRKFDAILTIATDNNQASAMIKAANAAHVPFVSLFGGDLPGVTADIGANGVVDGALSATALKSLMNNKGHVIKMKWTVLPVLADRDNGFKAVMKSARAIKVTEVEVKVPGQVDDTFNQLTNILASNKDVTGVWVGWDELALPALRAIQRAGMQDKIKVVGMDGIEEVLDELRKPSSPYVLTVAYSHTAVAEQGMDVIASVIDGRKLPFRALATRTCLVTHDNVPPRGQKVNFKTCSPFSAEMINK